MKIYSFFQFVNITSLLNFLFLNRSLLNLEVDDIGQVLNYKLFAFNKDKIK